MMPKVLERSRGEVGYEAYRQWMFDMQAKHGTIRNAHDKPLQLRAWHELSTEMQDLWNHVAAALEADNG